MNLRSSDVPQLHNPSYSSFGANASFITSPRILLAFSSFDVSKAANLQLKASVCSVSATGGPGISKAGVIPSCTPQGSRISL